MGVEMTSKLTEVSKIAKWLLDKPGLVAFKFTRRTSVDAGEGLEDHGALDDMIFYIYFLQRLEQKDRRENDRSHKVRG